MRRYVPILKGRQGEFNALGEIQLSTRRNVLPLIEVVSSDPTDLERVIDSCNRAMAKLITSWGADRVLLDGGLLDLSLDLRGRARGPLWELTEQARRAGVQAVPVIRLADDVLARTDATAACSTDGHGLCVRLVVQDLDEEPEDVELRLEALLHDVGVARADTDLVLDIGAVDSELAARGGARIIVAFFRALATVQDWRSFTVAGGAFPEDLSAFQPWVVSRRPRFDALLYDQVVGKRLPREPDFGDYVVVHPQFKIGAPFAPPPQLRYTVAGEWLVLKGGHNDQRGNAQFFEVCEIISNMPEFVGAALGAADARIASPREHGPGNGSTWCQISTVHHVDLVVSRLANLGEP